MSNPPQFPHVPSAHSLVETCQQIRALLDSYKPSPSLRIISPALAESLPLVKNLLVGVEDLAERTRLLELQVSRLLELDATGGRS